MSRHVSVDENTVALAPSNLAEARALVEANPDSWEVFDDEGCGWWWYQNADGTWTISLDAESTDEDADCRIFSLFAHLVPAGQYIALHSEYGDHWRYYFTGTDCRIEEGTVTYAE